MNIKKLELSLQEFAESEWLDLPDGSLLKFATERTRADRINLGSTNKAVMKGDLNFLFEQQEKR